MDPLGPYASLSASMYIPSGGDDYLEPNFVALDPKYLCVACHQLLKEPLQTNCGHRLCRSCADQALAEAGTVGFMCPAKEEDCEVITKDKVFKVLFNK